VDTVLDVNLKGVLPDDGSYVTGQTLNVSGGLSMW
jgi:hypothetical protein